ncbi:phosphotransferase family protein [Nocardioides sp.]|uniref:phosphotransferase family protein n=1 Tax=Nocardioides sp. TaxID=35761 RepID=UPI0039E3E2EE
MSVRGVDDALIESLRRRVAQRVGEWRPGAELLGIRPLTGGTSSLTFLAEVGAVAPAERTVVLKVAPPGLAPVRNRDVLRQARLLSALEGQPRPIAPDLLFTDAGDPPDTPPLLAMNLVPGECVEPVLAEDGERPPPTEVRARCLDAAAVLAALHSVTPAEVGLGDEPVVALDAEIERWTRAFETLPDGLRGDYEVVAKALHETIPAPLPAVVNHGDFRLGNTLCEDGRVNAVIDWEIWSVGDPRVDIAWFTFFADDAAHPAVEPGLVAGTPSRDEIVAAYESAAGLRLPELDWFHALTRYKEAGLTGLLLKRADKDGTTMKPALARMRPALPTLLVEALDLLGR